MNMMPIHLLILMMLVLMQSMALGVEVAASQPAAVDLSSPKSATISYFQAVARGDLAAAKESAVRSQKTDLFIDAVVAESKAKKEYMQAARKKLGPDKVNAPDLTEFLIQMVQNAPVQETGDSAIIGQNQDFPARKVEGKWRFDLAKQNPDAAQLDASISYLKKSAEAYAQFTATVPDGKWKTFDEMETERLIQAPPVPEPPVLQK